MENLKHKIEAVLFAVGKRMHIEEICKVCKTKQELVVEALNGLKTDYEDRSSPVKVLNDGEMWKLSVAEKFIPVIQNLGVETELSKSVMETLAVIAWKYPILQNEVIHIRTNKAYDHLSDLEERGFVSRSKHGRTRTIRLTEKFFQYFDLPNKEAAENAFKNIVPIEIQEKVNNAELEIVKGEKTTEEIKAKRKTFEEQLKAQRKEQIKLEAGLKIEDEEGKTHDLKEYDSEENKEVAIEDEKTGEPIDLESYGEKEEKIEVEEKKLDNLEVYEETEKEIKKEEEIEDEKSEEERKDEINEEEEPQKVDIEYEKETTDESKGLQVEDEKVEKEIEKLLHPEEEEKDDEEKKSRMEESKEKEEQPKEEPLIDEGQSEEPKEKQ